MVDFNPKVDIKTLLQTAGSRIAAGKKALNTAERMANPEANVSNGAHSALAGRVHAMASTQAVPVGSPKAQSIMDRLRTEQKTIDAISGEGTDRHSPLIADVVEEIIADNR